MATNRLMHHINALDILLIIGRLKLDIHEFLKGGHFKIPDDGEVYEALSQIPGAEKRISSHFRGEEKEELGIHCGYIIPEILILSVKPKSGKKTSHLQTEASAWRGIKGVWKHPHTLKHISDTLWYFLLNLYTKMLIGGGINLGPYGYSQHTDNNPLNLSANQLPKSGAVLEYLEKLVTVEDSTHPTPYTVYLTSIDLERTTGQAQEGFSKTTNTEIMKKKGNTE